LWQPYHDREGDDEWGAWPSGAGREGACQEGPVGLSEGNPETASGMSWAGACGVVRPCYEDLIASLHARLEYIGPRTGKAESKAKMDCGWLAKG
jgi:hypothetical protein